MDTSLLTSIIGIFVFATIMYIGFKYADGSEKVSEAKKDDYLIWTNNHGRRMRNGIIIISIIFGISMIIQISNLI